MLQNWFQYPTHRRSPSQVWILFLLESPPNTQAFYNLNNVINWTATFRHDSDLVAPYEKYFMLPSLNEMHFKSRPTSQQSVSFLRPRFSSSYSTPWTDKGLQQNIIFCLQFVASHQRNANFLSFSSLQSFHWTISKYLLTPRLNQQTTKQKTSWNGTEIKLLGSYLIVGQRILGLSMPESCPNISTSTFLDRKFFTKWLLQCLHLFSFF